MHKQNTIIIFGSIIVTAVISLLLYFNPSSEPPETDLKLSSDQISSLLGIKDNKSVKISDIESGRGGIKVKSISLQGRDNAEIELHDINLRISSTDNLVYSISLLNIGKIDILDWKTAQRVQLFDVEIDKPSDGFLTNLEEAFSSAKSGEAIKTASLLCARLGIGRIEYMARSNEENIKKVSIEGFSINDALSDIFGELSVTNITFGDMVSGKNLRVLKVNRSWADQLLALLTTSKRINSSTTVEPTLTAPKLRIQDARTFPFDGTEIEEISLVANKLPLGDKLGAGLVKISSLHIGFDQSLNGRMSGAKISVSAIIPTEILWSGPDNNWNTKVLDFFNTLGNSKQEKHINLSFQLDTTIDQGKEESNISLHAPGFATVSLKTKTRGIMNSLGKFIALQNPPLLNDVQVGISSLALDVRDDGILSFLLSDRVKERDSIHDTFRMVLGFFPPQEQNRLSSELEGFLIAPSGITLTGEFNEFISSPGDMFEALSKSHVSFIAANPQAVATGKAIAEAREQEKELKRKAEAQAAQIIAEANRKAKTIANEPFHKSESEAIPAPSIQPTTLPVECFEPRQCLALSLIAAAHENIEAIRSIATRFDSLNKPAPGNRKISRKLNSDGLAAFGRGDFNAAVISFRYGTIEDPRDAEIAANLGHALAKVGQQREAVEVLTRALLLDPRRTSTWTPLAEALALSDRTEEAIASLWIGYLWSSNREKSIAFYTARAEDERNIHPRVAEIYNAVINWVTGVQRPSFGSLAATHN